MMKHIMRKALLPALVFLLAACGNNSHAAYSDTPTPTPSYPHQTENISEADFYQEPTKQESFQPTDINSTASNPPVSNMPTPDAKQDPPETGAAFEENTACGHMNYSNSFPLIFTQKGEVRFHYDDTITITNANGSTVISLSHAVQPEGQNFSDPDAWFFCGAIQSNHLVYAHYDYLNGALNSPSMLLQIDPSSCQVQCCILSQNPRKQFGDAFAILGETIYYTSTTYAGSTASTSIFCTDLNGNHAVECVHGMPGETIPFLTTDGNMLYFTIKSSASASRLVCLDPLSGTQDMIAPELSAVEFLAALNGFALTSVANNTLHYFDQNGSAFALKLTEDASLIAGAPLTDGRYVYIPFINYSSSASTQVAVVDLSSCQLQTLLTLSDEYFYCIGMAGQSIYAENVDEFMVFHLSQESEELE